jgi:inosine-uridine nucleoside N-ribohydrolase
MRRVTIWLLGCAGVAAAALLVTLALPVETWRTGRQDQPPLPEIPAAGMPEPPERIWIDSDAACGAGARVDPDDCLAILYLGLQDGIRIAGLSTVFGNAVLEQTDRTARRLAALLAEQGGAFVPVHRGAATPLGDRAAGPTEATTALHDALSAGRLTLLALGPLTNLAAALDARPDLRDRVERIIAVMGRRPGHIFHPSENSGSGSFLGHGPIFRDFNVIQDTEAVERVVEMDVPLVLVPYDAATAVEIDRATLDRLAATGPAGRWVARRSTTWLDYWNADVGREGFYPFDLIAAVFATHPERFACARVSVEVGRDGSVFFPFSRMPALLIEESLPEATGNSPSLYCHRGPQTLVYPVTDNPD